MSGYDTSFDAEPDSDDDAVYRAPAYYLEDQSSDLATGVEGRPVGRNYEPKPPQRYVRT